MLNSKNVGPYVSVSFDQVRKFPNGRSFRMIVFGAYNAMGLIGSEYNGIAVFDEDNKSVVADCIGKADSGYFGPTLGQIELFDYLATCTWANFRNAVNNSDRLRYEI